MLSTIYASFDSKQTENNQHFQKNRSHSFIVHVKWFLCIREIAIDGKHHTFTIDYFAKHPSPRNRLTIHSHYTFNPKRDFACDFQLWLFWFRLNSEAWENQQNAKLAGSIVCGFSFFLPHFYFCCCCLWFRWRSDMNLE